MQTICKICKSESVPFFKGKILNNYEISYFRCTSCRFIQTEKPYWLKEAYTDAIAQLDIGLIDRNFYYSGIVEKLILNFYPETNTYLDYGGGYGLFVRTMRDNGFSFYRYDLYCNNLFAKYFDLQDAPMNRFDIVTAFEVIEHLNEPLSEIGKMLELGDNLFISTLLVSDDIKDFGSWWYRAPLSGQHIAFYTMESLQYLAKKFGKKLYSNGTNFHIFSDTFISEDKLKEIFTPVYESRLKRLINILKGEKGIIRRKSLLEEDYKKIEQVIVGNKK